MDKPRQSAPTKIPPMDPEAVKSVGFHLIDRVRKGEALKPNPNRKKVHLR